MKNLGKVSVTVEDNWDKSKEYSELCIVTTDNGTYISKKYVPKNIEISNEEYWMNMNFKSSSNEFYKIPGDITQLINGNDENAINKIKEVFGTIDGWFFVNQIDKDFLIDKNGITMSYRAGSVGAGNYMFNISYYAQGIVNLELFARQIYTNTPPTLNIERVTINKSSSVSSIENGDIVLPDKSTMTLEAYKTSGKSDAIGVVFDKHKGLYVNKHAYNGILLTGKGADIFKKDIGYDYYDGRGVQKVNLMQGSSTDFPVFKYANDNNLYVASNGELNAIYTNSKIIESLNYITSNNFLTRNKVYSCTRNLRQISSIRVFYGGFFSDDEIMIDPTTALDYLLIGLL